MRLSKSWLFVVVFWSIPCLPNTNIYKSLGQFGETRYTQYPPSTPFTLVTLRHADNQSTNQACQTLRNSLTTLLSGGIIHEIDEQGNKTLLGTEQVNQRIEQVRQALAQHCHG